MIQRLSRSVDKAMDMGADFADARFEDRKISTILVVNDELRNFQDMSKKGVCIRALVGGSWGQSSTCRLDPDSLLEAAEKAVKMAKHNAGKTKKEVSLESMATIKKSIEA
ncbi:MAG: DNA gyrase modulator, partial [Thermoplasmata archaeon]